MRAEIEKIGGAAALDERAVRDMWPLGLMEERDGVQRPKVLVVSPSAKARIPLVVVYFTPGMAVPGTVL